jgi:ketosteroid isomerase-like protein
MTSTNESTSLSTEISQSIENWLAALRSKHPDAVVACYAPESTAFTLAPPLAHTYGGEYQREFLENWYPGFQGAMGFEITEPTIVASDDIAYCHFMKQLSAATAEGESFSFWYRVTLGLRRIDGDWKIVHEHESVPFHMDGSFLAATELSH